jgi:hypothetical protein
MRKFIIIFTAVLIGMTAGSSIALGQTGAQAPRARNTPSVPHDPKDLNGVWSRTGGDRGFNNDVPPMTPEGQKLFDEQKPSYGRALGSDAAKKNTQEHIGRRRAVPPAQGNDLVGGCNPQGVPRILFFPRPFEFVQVQNRVLQIFQWHRALRDIRIGRELPTEVDVPTWYGVSVGKWDGDTFVVETIGFDDRTWLDHFGYPHSADMKLTERYRRLNRDTLELVITVDDPKIYTRPWVSEKKTYTLQPTADLIEEICAPIDEVDNFNRRIRDPAGGVTNR